MGRPNKWLAMICGILVITLGCGNDTKPSNEKFEKAINTYFENRNECLFPEGLKFPYEVSPGDQAKADRKRMDALTRAGLLKQQDAPMLHISRYTLTPLGERVAPRFCYGHRVVKSIDSFTTPAKQNGFLESNVSYHYSMMEVPAWARTDEMEATFQKMAASISDRANDQITLATAGAGWQVPQ
jgi:hypothetical protein